MDTNAQLDLEAPLAIRDTSKRVPVEIAQEILRAIAAIEYGSVEVVVHEGKVMQIECREKIRLSQGGSVRKTTKS